MPMKNGEGDRIQLAEEAASFPKVITIVGFLWLIGGGLIAVGTAVLLLRANEGRQAFAAMGVFGLVLCHSLIVG